jgi:hypothetical protein
VANMIAALDIADEGTDLNALAIRRGCHLVYLSSWSGAGSDIHATVQRAMGICEQHGCGAFRYDGDGLGAGARGAARIINEARRAAGKSLILDEPYRGSAAPLPGELIPGRQNTDHFGNQKAMSWMAFRARLQHTHLVVTEGLTPDPNQLVSFDPALPELHQLLMELTQPTYSLNAAGKVLIDKVGSGARSPNLADAVVMCFAPVEGEGSFFAIPPPSAGLIDAPEIRVPEAKLPWRPDVIFAAASGATGPERDALAVVYFAVTGIHDANPPVVVLDYRIDPVTGLALDAWLPSVFTRLQELRGLCEARCPQVALAISPHGIGPELFSQGISAGLGVEPVDEDLAELEIVDRAVRASTFVRRGHVQFTREALERTVLFRGTERNHLLDAANKFDAATAPLCTDLLGAFCDGVLLAFKSELVAMRTRSSR